MSNSSVMMRSCQQLSRAVGEHADTLTLAGCDENAPQDIAVLRWNYAPAFSALPIAVVICRTIRAGLRSASSRRDTRAVA